MLTITSVEDREHSNNGVKNNFVENTFYHPISYSLDRYENIVTKEINVPWIISTSNKDIWL